MLRPFSRFCVLIGAIPASIIESISYEEQLIMLIKFLKEKVVPAIDGNTEAIKAIENWIENVDLQEFVDERLDEMVESGELETLLLNYTTVTKVYDTHADMLADAGLKNNSRCKTLGYYEINDGGGAEYLIVDEVPTSYYEDLTNVENLYAMLIIDGDINIKSLGCSNDVDSGVILNDLEEKMTNNYTLYVPKGEYLITTTFETTKCLGIYGDGYSSIINCDTNLNCIVFNSPRINLHDFMLYNTLSSVSAGAGILFNHGNRCKIDKIKIDGFYFNLFIKRHQYTTVTNCNIEEWGNNGIVFENATAPDSGDSIVSQCTLQPNNRNRNNTTAILITSGGGVRIENNKINWYTTGYQPSYGIVLQPTANVTTFDLFVIGNSIENCKSAGVYVDVHTSSSSFGQIVIDSNEIAGYNKEGVGIHLNGESSSGNNFTLKDIIVSNNIIGQHNVGVEYGKLTGLNLSNNTYRQCNTCIDKILSSNRITIDEQHFVDILSNGYIFKGIYGGNDIENPQGIYSIKDSSYCNAVSGSKYRLEFGNGMVVKGKVILKGQAEGVGPVYQETDFIATYISGGYVNVTLTPITSLNSGGFCGYEITESRDQAAHTLTLGYSSENTSITSFTGDFEIQIDGRNLRRLVRL